MPTPPPQAVNRTQILLRDKVTELEIFFGGRKWSLKRVLTNSVSWPERTGFGRLNAHA
jgi:hypothetical protein